jgi:hypothetical protein
LLLFSFFGCHPSPKAEDLLLSLHLHLLLRLPLPPQVPAVILNAVKDPEEAHPGTTFRTFKPMLCSRKARSSIVPDKNATKDPTLIRMLN